MATHDSDRTTHAPAATATGAGPAPADFPDRRRSPRHPIATLGLVLMDAAAAASAPIAEGQGLQVIVLNVSRHGAGLRTPVPLHVGQVFPVRIGAGPLHLRANLQVVSCRAREDGQFDVGGQFVGKPM